MKAAEIKAAFPSEAELCDCFIESLRKHGGWTIYPETSGFDILCVYEATGHQLGIEAKLSLNAKVIDQILPRQYMGYADTGVAGPDFRAIVVPSITESNAGLAAMLEIIGVKIFVPEQDWCRNTGAMKWRFRISRHDHGERMADRREYDTNDGKLYDWDTAWHDWNPPARCTLPEIVPTVRCGVPAPVQLTPWKIGALRVLADLEIYGFVTAKSVRDHGIDARRFCATDGWLQMLGNGKWARGKIPAFDQQHPEAYAQVLAEARAKRDAGAQVLA